MQKLGKLKIKDEDDGKLIDTIFFMVDNLKKKKEKASSIRRAKEKKIRIFPLIYNRSLLLENFIVIIQNGCLHSTRVGLCVFI